MREGALDCRLEAIAERDALARALATLSDEEREAIALRFGADLTVPEIAATLGEKLTTVEGRVYRALRKLPDCDGPERRAPAERLSLERAILRRRPRAGAGFSFARRRFIRPFFRRSAVSMARGDVRIAVTLACEECKRRNYQTNKSKRNNPDRIRLRKYCKWCRRHTGHRETR